MGEIIIGVDDRASSAAAIRYAAEESRRRGERVRLVHITPEPLSIVGARALGALEAELRAAASERLAWAYSYASARLPSELISRELVAGAPSSALVRAARAGSVDGIVLGSDRLSVAERVLFGSVTAMTAAAAPVPVTAVPEGWGSGPVHHRVLVAVKSAGTVSLPLVRRALQVAADRNATLGIVHVGHCGRSYQDVVTSGVDLPAWRAGAARRIRRQVDPLLAAFPEVTVDVVLTYGRVVDELGRLAVEADLLLIDRRAHRLPFGHLGRVGRRLLRQCPCPLEVDPAIPARATRDARPRRAGELT